VTLAVLAATVILSLSALFLPGYLEQRRLDAVNASIKNLDAEVRTVDRIVRDVEQKKKLATTIELLPSSAIRPLPVLRELTELLPADAWLTTLSLENKGMEMTGQAAAASTLIPVLENSPRFQRVEFASPVTRGRDREQFRIQAAWETPPGSLIASTVAASPPPVVGPPRVPGAPVAGPAPSALPAPGPSQRPTDPSAPAEIPGSRRTPPARTAEPGR
jgi:Tfp pilus assembly protein PilN